ncbi:hypothetical protein GCK72_010365 [Caenorhabditis remanei]|uniref:Major sperm protein n=1 Tax=Caenorhabditis remanei TaxID=31234 RepID=A0A6A5H6F1_CAERE|nr:hypothetical protein GCK72_010365 [Caenorhabditis remanei]KAF1762103.1 hypothetical protein GCK72_010365 [Caenorhabditis remanei]
MLYESILFGSTFVMTSFILMTGCSSKKKAAPSVAPSPQSASKSPATTPSVAKSTVSKSPATETKATETGETKDTTNAETKNEETKGNDEETNDKTEAKKDETRQETVRKDDDKKDDGEKKKEEDEKENDKKEENKNENKKKKEDFIRADPTELSFESATTSQKKLRLKNLTGKKLMFKVKSTTTNTYLINPVFGKIEPNNFADVMITHRPSGKREDKLVIVSSEMLGKELEMAKTFKQIKTTGNDVLVKLVST